MATLNEERRLLVDMQEQYRQNPDARLYDEIKTQADKVGELESNTGMYYVERFGHPYVLYLLIELWKILRFRSIRR